MSKAKKPRNKKYHPRPVKIPYWSAQWYEKTERKLDTAHLLVELTLPAGKLTGSDIDLLEDTMNWGLSILAHRYKNLDMSELTDAEPILIGARHALNEIIYRKNEGVTQGYIAKGDEIKLISQGFSIIIPLIKEAIKLGPGTAMKEFKWGVQTGLRKQREEQKMKKKEPGKQNEDE